MAKFVIKLLCAALVLLVKCADVDEQELPVARLDMPQPKSDEMRIKNASLDAFPVRGAQNDSITSELPRNAIAAETSFVDSSSAASVINSTSLSTPPVDSSSAPASSVHRSSTPTTTIAWTEMGSQAATPVFHNTMEGKLGNSTRLAGDLLQLPHSCVWSEWGPCSASCDYGRHERRMVSATDMSKPCWEIATQSALCFVRPCPIDCAYDQTWLAWSSCTEPCGGGHRYRTRFVIQAAMFGGAPCSSSELTMNDTCNEEPCAYECRITGQWGSWSSCAEEDGVVSQRREIPFDPAVKTARPGRNTTCDETVQHRPCHVESTRAVDVLPAFECMLTEWSAWSPCSASCGTGTQYRTRKILIPAVGSAPPCGPTYANQTCNTISCLESNIASLCNRRRNTYISLGRCSPEYIYCTPGAVVVFSTCPLGQVFNAAVGFCVKMELIPECAILSRIENTCQGRPNGMYPLCTCCPQYMVCWESMAVTRTCSAGQVFSSVPYGRCVDRSQADDCF